MEIAPPRQRSLFSIIALACWPTGAVLAALMAMQLRDWRTLMLVEIVPAALALVVVFFIPVSH